MAQITINEITIANTIVIIQIIVFSCTLSFSIIKKEAFKIQRKPQL